MILSIVLFSAILLIFIYLNKKPWKIRENKLEDEYVLFANRIKKNWISKIIKLMLYLL